MSKKCKAYSRSGLGLELPDSRKAFYAGWDAALAAQPAVQEPEAQALSRDAVLANMAGWLRGLADDVTIPYFTNGAFKADCNEAADVLLEIAPPAAQKPWVGLTDEEVKYFQMTKNVYPGITKEIEAKLKEKNHDH